MSSDVELAKPGKQVLHRAIASKIVHGYQLEFVMVSGEVHYGFVIGLDDVCVQIYDTGFGRDFEENDKYQIEFNDVNKPRRRWLLLENIESVGENFFGLKHMTKESQRRLDNERQAMIKIAKLWLYPDDKKGN